MSFEGRKEGRKVEVVEVVENVVVGQVGQAGLAWKAPNPEQSVSE